MKGQECEGNKIKRLKLFAIDNPYYIVNVGGKGYYARDIVWHKKLLNDYKTSYGNVKIIDII